MADRMEDFRDFVIKNVEIERHCSFFPRRNVLWSTVCNASWFSDILDEMGKVFDAEEARIRQKKIPKMSDDESAILMRSAWSGALTESGLENKCLTLTRESLPNQDISAQDEDFVCIFGAVGRLVFAFKVDEKRQQQLCGIPQAQASTSTATGSSSKAKAKKGTSTSSSRKRKKEQRGQGSDVDPIPPQPDWGMQIVASGCLGEMFRLCKKNRKKKAYQDTRTVLSAVILPNTQKAWENIPIQHRARDRGGFYLIHPSYLPFLRELDRCVREEFPGGQHGHDLVKVIQSKIKARDDLYQMCNQLTRSRLGRLTDDKCMTNFTTTLIRKYVHARIGVFLKGEFDQSVEAKGVRAKGGSSLRDSLFVLSKRGSGTGSRGRGRGRGKAQKKSK